MSQPLASTANAAKGAAGGLLRHWRDVRGKTQLDLSFDAGVSQKHISFVESGRSTPSRQMLLDLAQALDVPLRDRNTLLMAAGYAPVYAGDNLDDPGMAPVARALRRMLRQQEPFPALVMDRRWNVLLTNDAAPRFFGCFIDMAAQLARWGARPRNLLHLVFDPAGLRPHLANWDEAAPSLIARVHREALGQVIDAGTRALLADLMRYPGVDPAWRAPLPGGDLPLIPLAFTKDGVTLRYFSMVTTVGTPQTVAAQELRLECLFPADEATEEAHGPFLDTHAA
jgi:transcriptional regulator with XRE-family HTH domain